MQTKWALGGRGVAMAALALSVAVPAAADDAAVRRRIEGRLEKAGLVRNGDIRVDVRAGTAVLDGAVTTVYDRQRAGKAARKETKQVENRLKVLPERRPDSQIRREAQDAILDYTYYGVFDSVELGVEDGVVLLRGSVRHDGRRKDIEERVARLAGVREIVNEIEVQSVSSFDDQLRGQLYRAIYLNDQFIHWSRGVHPPVRIVVDRGRITLTGYVPTAMDKQLVGHIARSTSAFAVDNRVQVDGEEEKEPAKTARS